MATWVYNFTDAAGKSKKILGGKGAGLAEMTKIDLPVPPGFVITAKCCLAYQKKGEFPQKMWPQILEELKGVEERSGKKFGDAKNPLLVSVRSGAAVSMPGMMDTVLNLGLNEKTLQGLIAKTDNERFGYDAYRRFIQMFANIVMGVPLKKFEDVLEDKRNQLGIKNDTEFTAADLQEIISKYKDIYQKETGENFPTDPQQQLKEAVRAVFDSWDNKRAIDYREFNNIPHDLGTAVNVQTMVFGNMGDNSATGVAFTRSPATGENKLYGEFLVNAQGEDVVAGIRTPKDINQLEKIMPEIYQQIKEITQKLEKHYTDMQDIEFTVEEDKLWILQTRTGKRTAAAAVKIAHDMVEEKLIDRKTALLRLDAEQISQLLHTQIDPKADYEVIAKGLAASPGAATGEVVFSADKAEEKGKAGNDVILVRPETSPDDVHGVLQSRGVLTARGGMTSHAAVVARGLGKPCVSGCEEIVIDEAKKQFQTRGQTIDEGEIITLNGSTGEVVLGRVPMIDPQIGEELKKILNWADKEARLEVYANADYPRDAQKAREFGAIGIGLCRTEHMFMEQERLPYVQQMILAEEEESRAEALEKISQFQKEDFIGLFRIMKDLPLIIRLIDPPLHEFLPKPSELKEKITAVDGQEKQKLEKTLAAVMQIQESNPMLGLRGCRLAILMPEIITAQTKAILEGALEVQKDGPTVNPKIMVPLVGNVKEFEFVKEKILATAEEVLADRGEELDFTIGTMIELPRAALTAGEIAQEADFFSFGTNDLTQTTLGMSRDDAEGKFLGVYEEKGIINESPFKTLDQDGVGQLVALGTQLGRKTKSDLSVGICGEHGGDPKSITFCHQADLTYVSCSPFRVPVARLAVAQAAIKAKKWLQYVKISLCQR